MNHKLVRFRPAFAIALGLLVYGCGGQVDSSVDSLLNKDGGSTLDAGVYPPVDDAGNPVPLDAGWYPPVDDAGNPLPLDAGWNPPFDAGWNPPFDAGIPNPTDAGISKDGGKPPLPPKDAGWFPPPTDAGLMD